MSDSRLGAGIITGGIIGLAAGMLLAPDPIPRTETVMVEVPKYIERKEVETKVVHKPFPRECRLVVDLVESLDDSANNFHARGKKLLAYMSKASYEDVKDPGNKFEIYVTELQKKQTDDLYVLFEGIEAVESFVASCEQAIEEQE